MMRSRNAWAARATGRTSKRPAETKRITSYGHVGCGGAIVATTNVDGTMHGCAKCGKPTTPIGGNIAAPDPNELSLSSPAGGVPPRGGEEGDDR